MGGSLILRNNLGQERKKLRKAKHVTGAPLKRSDLHDGRRRVCLDARLSSQNHELEVYSSLAFGKADHFRVRQLWRMSNEPRWMSGVATRNLRSSICEENPAHDLTLMRQVREITPFVFQFLCLNHVSISQNKNPQAHLLDVHLIKICRMNTHPLQW